MEMRVLVGRLPRDCDELRREILRIARPRHERQMRAAGVLELLRPLARRAAQRCGPAFAELPRLDRIPSNDLLSAATNLDRLILAALLKPVPRGLGVLALLLDRIVDDGGRLDVVTELPQANQAPERGLYPQLEGVIRPLGRRDIGWAGLRKTRGL
jgi:hypothetical protein